MMYLDTDLCQVTWLDFAVFSSVLCLGGAAIDKYLRRTQLALGQEYKGLGMESRQ